jgi:hypothetical protein
MDPSEYNQREIYQQDTGSRGLKAGNRLGPRENKHPKYQIGFDYERHQAHLPVFCVDIVSSYFKGTKFQE